MDVEIDDSPYYKGDRIYILAYFSIPWRSNGRGLVRVYVPT